MNRILLSISLAIATTASASTARLASCETVKQQIREEGAQHVLDRMWANNETEFMKVLPHVAAAEPCWLEVADSLKTVADAGASESLGAAMSRALTKDPQRALPYLSSEGRFPIELVCAGSQVETEESAAGFKRWGKSTQIALQNAKLPSQLEAKRQQCLGELAKQERRVK